MSRWVLMAAAMALAACASAPPERGGPPRPRLFISPAGEPFRGPDGLDAWLAGADADHDGAVTQAEFRADALRVFKRLDANGDGVIDGFEIQAYERDIVPEITRMSFDEGLRAGGGRRMGRGRGRGGMGRQMEGGRMGGGEMGGRMAGAGRQGAAPYSLINEPQPVSGADADVDGRVTLDEWLGATARRFALLDHDKTGRLTRDSLRPTAPQKR